MKRLGAFFSLFMSLGTLVCCALPALLVSLGLGAAVAGLVANVPQLVWISEHKNAVFISTALILIIAGILQWRARQIACSGNTAQQAACTTAKDYSLWIYWLAVALFAIGTLFAFILN